jgi:hypothetical protein
MGEARRLRDMGVRIKVKWQLVDIETGTVLGATKVLNLIDAIPIHLKKSSQRNFHNIDLDQKKLNELCWASEELKDEKNN